MVLTQSRSALGCRGGSKVQTKNGGVLTQIQLNSLAQQYALSPFLTRANYPTPRSARFL